MVVGVVAVLLHQPYYASSREQPGGFPTHVLRYCVAFTNIVSSVFYIEGSDELSDISPSDGANSCM